jgi:hypothetical protein
MIIKTKSSAVFDEYVQILENINKRKAATIRKNAASWASVDLASVKRMFSSNTEDLGKVLDDVNAGKLTAAGLTGEFKKGFDSIVAGMKEDLKLVTFLKTNKVQIGPDNKIIGTGTNLDGKDVYVVLSAINSLPAKHQSFLMQLESEVGNDKFADAVVRLLPPELQHANFSAQIDQATAAIKLSFLKNVTTPSAVPASVPAGAAQTVQEAARPGRGTLDEPPSEAPGGASDDAGVLDESLDDTADDLVDGTSPDTTPDAAPGTTPVSDTVPTAGTVADETRQVIYDVDADKLDILPMEEVEETEKTFLQSLGDKASTLSRFVKDNMVSLANKIKGMRAAKQAIDGSPHLDPQGGLSDSLESRIAKNEKDLQRMADDAGVAPPSTKPSSETVSKVKAKLEDPTPVPPKGTPKPNGELGEAPKSFLEGLRSLMTTESLSGIKYLFRGAAILGAGGAALIFLYQWFDSPDAMPFKDQIDAAASTTKAALIDMETQEGSELATLKYKLQQQMTEADAVGKQLDETVDSDARNVLKKKYLEKIGLAAETIDQILAKKDQLASQATSPVQFDSFIREAQGYKNSINSFRAGYIAAYNRQQPAQPRQQGSGPISGGTGNATEQPESASSPGSSNWNEAKTSAVPVIVKNVLLSPIGLLFLDPENKFSGLNGYPKTSNIKQNFINAAGALYDLGITNPMKLKKHIDSIFNSKQSRAFFSQYKQALRFYRPKVQDYRRQYLQEFIKMYKQNISNKNASINMDTTNMIKRSDDISNRYISDASKGLKDQAAKSYFSRLKSLHENNLGKAKSDYETLYASMKDEEDITLKAHPTSFISIPARANSGLVENGHEQQARGIELANTLPSGNFLNRNAFVISNLVKIANAADESGNEQVSNLIDSTIRELLKNNS